MTQGLLRFLFEYLMTLDIVVALAFLINNIGFAIPLGAIALGVLFFCVRRSKV